MGYFTEATLEKFNSMCSEGVDFGEAPVYDFARCVTSGGKVYGVSEDEQCKVGRKIGDKEITETKGSDTRMAKLKKAFIKKMGREMTPAELKKAENMIASIGVPIPSGESAESMLQKMLPKGAKVIPVKQA
jgi:hypothetical protein